MHACSIFGLILPLVINQPDYMIETVISIAMDETNMIYVK